MKLISTVFVLVIFALLSVDALLADGLKIEANHGEDVTLPFSVDKAEEAGRLRIIFTSATTNETRLIAQRCAGSERCDAVEEPGVKLVERESVSVTIQRVNNSRSGVYKVQAFNGKYVCERNITLVVNEAQFSSTSAPPHTSTTKPSDSSDLIWLCAVIPVVILLVVCKSFCKCRRILCFKKRELESNSSSVAVFMNTENRENAEALLTDIRVS